MQLLNNITGRAVARLSIDGSIVISTTPGPGTYISGVYMRSADGWSTYKHEIKFIAQQDYNTAVVALSTGRRIKFQTGNDVGGSVTWSPLQTQVVVSYEGDADSTGLSGAGFVLSITSSDLLYTGAIWWRTRSWRGTASDIVGQIGESFGMTAKIQPGRASQLTLLQCFEPTLSFLHRVVDTYMGGTGADDVTAATHADVLMIGNAGWSEWPRYQVNFPGPGASSFQHLDHEQDLTYPGTSGVTGIQYNPLTGISRNVNADPDSSVTRFASQSPPGDPLAIYTRARHSLVSDTQTFWTQSLAEANLNQLGAKFNVTGPDYLLPGAIVQVNLPDPLDPWAGLYQLYQVYTELNGGEIVSRVTLRRGEFNSATITAPGIPPQAEAGQANTSTNSKVIKSVTPSG